MAAGLVGTAVALGAWQCLTATKVLDPTAVPTMTSAASTLFSSLFTGRLWTAVGQTLEGMGLGFAIGSIAALVAGVLIGLNRQVFKSTFIVIEFLKTIPSICILPLLVSVYGTTLKMKVLIVIYGVFFPMVMQTIYGVRSVDPVVRDTARVFHYGRWMRFTKVILPSAAPYLATGLRLAASGALLLAILAELIVGGNGLGVQIWEAQNGGDISYSYALIVFTGIIGVVLVLGLTSVERRMLHWHEAYRGD